MEPVGLVSVVNSCSGNLLQRELMETVDDVKTSLGQTCCHDEMTFDLRDLVH